MQRITIAGSALALAVAFGCGGKQKQEVAEPDETEEGEEVATGEGELVPQEKLDEIQRFFVNKRPHVAHCYSEALEREQIDRKAVGRVSLTLKISAGGAPSAIRITQTTLRNKPVEECLKGEVAEWKFPAPGQDIEFSFSYDFEPE